MYSTCFRQPLVRARSIITTVRRLQFVIGIAIVLFFGTFTHFAKANDAPHLTVITIEFPPLLGQKLEDYGTIFALLQTYAHQHFKGTITPDFLPPARAAKLVAENKWCLSFYPPPNPDSQTNFVKLTDEPVHLGLFRKRRPDTNLVEDFTWSDLSDLRGSSVAVLRSNVGGSLLSDMSDAGIELVFVETQQQGIRLMLAGRVDYAQGVAETLSHMQDVDTDNVELSKTYLLEATVGFYYRSNCADIIFKAGHIPHLQDKDSPSELVQ